MNTIVCRCILSYVHVRHHIQIYHMCSICHIYSTFYVACQFPLKIHRPKNPPKCSVLVDVGGGLFPVEIFKYLLHKSADGMAVVCFTHAWMREYVCMCAVCTLWKRRIQLCCAVSMQLLMKLHTDTCRHTYRHSHTHMQHVHTHTRTHKWTRKHTCTHSHTGTHRHTHTHTNTHANTHTRTQICIYTYKYISHIRICIHM